MSHHPRLSLLTSVCLGLMTAACAVGPDYRPALTHEPAPTTFVAATPQVATAGGEVTDDWWRLYKDPALDQLIGEALRANTDLRVASANLARARAALSEARTGLLTPNTDLTVSAVTGRSAGANAFAELEGRKARASATDTASFAASYELDLFGRLRRGAEAAHADVGAAKAALDLARVEVAAETAQAYVEACAYGEALASARRSQEIAHATDEVTARRYALGLGRIDAERASAAASQADAAVPPLEAQRKAALFSLAVLTGRPPETVIDAAAACVAPPRLESPTPVGDGAALLRRRPDIREAEQRLAGDTARIGVATASLFPSISLGGQIGIAGATPDKAATYNGTSFSVGPVLSWTVPNILIARERVAGASAQARASLASLDGVVLTALKDVETALANLDSERRRNTLLIAARDGYARALRIEQAKYEAGSASFLDLLDTQRSLQAAESDLALSDLRRSDAEIALFRALGGGWRSAPPVLDPTAGR